MSNKLCQLKALLLIVTKLLLIISHVLLIAVNFLQHSNKISIFLPQAKRFDISFICGKFPALFQKTDDRVVVIVFVLVCRHYYLNILSLLLKLALRKLINLFTSFNII